MRSRCSLWFATARCSPGRWLLGSALGLLACAGPATQTPNNPGLSFPNSLGEGHGDPDAEAIPPSTTPTPQASEAKSAGPSEKAPPALDSDSAERAKYGSLPDPAPLTLSSQWELALRFERGELSLASANKREFPQPVTTARRIGRFAVELWIGNELIDRVRFDFPLVAERPASTKATLGTPVRLDEGVSATRTILVPDSPRATRALLVDRATGRETPLPWPPDRPLGPDTTAPGGASP